MVVALEGTRMADARGAAPDTAPPSACPEVATWPVSADTGSLYPRGTEGRAAARRRFGETHYRPEMTQPADQSACQLVIDQRSNRLRG